MTDAKRLIEEIAAAPDRDAADVILLAQLPDVARALSNRQRELLLKTLVNLIRDKPIGGDRAPPSD